MFAKFVLRLPIYLNHETGGCGFPAFLANFEFNPLLTRTNPPP